MTSNKIAFINGSRSYFDETMSGFGGTQLVVLNIAKQMSKKYDIYVVHNKREQEFIGKSGINYVKNIDEKLFKVIIDVRCIRNVFLKNVKYIHWIHDPFLYNDSKRDANLGKYDNVISLTNIQASLWSSFRAVTNFVVINNPLILEPTEKKTNYNKRKIVAFSSKTQWNKCIEIVKNLRKLDNNITLHVCSPSYCDISNHFKQFDFVVNHGSLSHTKMMELLSDAFVCLYPTTFQENCPGVCYECMYYGIPMLTEYVEGSGLNEIIPKEFIFPSNCHINHYLNTLESWYKANSRPNLVWNERNREIYNQWDELIN